MAIIGGIFAAAGRFAGKVVTMLLGWASVLLFGRVPQSKQLLLALITFGSLAWVVALVGVIVPDAGSFLLAAVPRPNFVDPGWVRLAMVVLAIVLPIVIGILTVIILDPARRPKGFGLVVQVMRGYLYAPVLAVTLAVLAGIALWRKGRALAKGWQDAHVAVIVKPGGYERVVADLQRATHDAGIDLERTPAPAALTIPPRLLAAVGGPAVAALVPDELVSLTRGDLSILVYPSDIALLGEKRLVARARAAIVARLTLTEAYVTSAEESEKIEDRLAVIGRGEEPASGETFRSLDDELATLMIPFDEWETLYRLRLQVENQKRIPNASEPGTGRAESPGGATTALPSATPAPGEGEPWWQRVAAIGLIAMVAADLAFFVRDRRAR
jgi:hypothetical protein